jgi:hypothetical protein
LRDSLAGGSVSPVERERLGETQKERERDSEGRLGRGTRREREGGRERERERREREREIVTVCERESAPERLGERDRERERSYLRERERFGERQTERDRQKDRQTDRQTDKERQRERQRLSETSPGLPAMVPRPVTVTVPVLGSDSEPRCQCRLSLVTVKVTDASLRVPDRRCQWPYRDLEPCGLPVSRWRPPQARWGPGLAT